MKKIKNVILTILSIIAFVICVDWSISFIIYTLDFPRVMMFTPLLWGMFFFGIMCIELGYTANSPKWSWIAFLYYVMVFSGVIWTASVEGLLEGYSYDGFPYVVEPIDWYLLYTDMFLELSYKL